MKNKICEDCGTKMLRGEKLPEENKLNAKSLGVELKKIWFCPNKKCKGRKNFRKLVKEFQDKT